MKLAKIFKNKFFYLITGIFLNVLTVIGSLSLPSSVNKFSYAPFNFLWEFFTVNWCVWNSVLTVVYNLNEIKNEFPKADLPKKKQRSFGLLIALSNSVAMLVFTTLLFDRRLLPVERGAFWWTNSIIWHYIAPIIALTYFFQFVKLKKTDFNKKTFFWIAFPLPVIFFLANLFRGFLANPEYLGGKLKFKKFLIPPFRWFEEGKLTLLSLFIIFSLSSFWLFAFLLLKIKKFYFPKTIKLIKNKPLICQLIQKNKHS